MKIASRPGDESSNICGGVNRITEEEKIEGEMPSLLAINMIEGTQSAPLKQDRVIDRDPADADNDSMNIYRDTKFNDWDFQFQKILPMLKLKAWWRKKMKKGKIEIHHIITKVVAEDVNEYMVVVPEIVLSTSEVTIDDN